MNYPLTPIRCLYRGVDLYAKREGIISGDSRFTYAQFGERCERLAAGLRTEGVDAGDRVGILSFNTHQLLECYFGPPLIHAIAMPLNVRLTPTELTEILNHAEPSILIFENDFAPLVECFRKACPSICRYINVGDAIPQADFNYEELLSRGRIDRPEIRSFDENEIGEIFYTSGSTGTPKGVMLSHRTLYLHALAVTGSMEQTDRVVELHTIPLFHANGWSRPHTSVMNGCKQVLVRRFEPVGVLRAIQDEKASSMSVVPVMANALLNCPQLGEFDVSSLTEISIGGAAASMDLVARMEKAFGCLVMGGYGLTETSPVVSSAHHKATVRYANEEDRLHHLARAGWAILGTEIKVVDAAGQAVPRDMQTVGEVLVRGDNVMDGYFKEPEATAAAIQNDWLHTGDMAVWDDESYIHIVDRKKDMIVSGGENISSIEIEKAIFAHPAVLECAVVAAPDPKWGEIPVAIVVLKPASELSAPELTAFLEKSLAKFKLPRLVRFDAEPLPKTGTGKILKRELREAFWQGKERRVQGA
jgi:fatty-acyl-CoA synthase